MMTEPFFEKPEPPRWSDHQLPESENGNRSGWRGMAVTSLILGIIGILFCAGFGIGSLCGLVLGLAALRYSKSEAPSPYVGIASTGITLNIISLILLPLILLPGTLAARRSANDESARKSLRAIHSAQMAYAHSHDGNFTANLANLDLDPTIREMGTNVKSGFRLGKMTITAADGFHPARFSITAEPATSQGIFRTGNTSFYVDETGLIRQSLNSSVPATAESEPVRE